MWLEHRLSALLQLYLHSPFNTWLQYIAHRPLQAETRNIWDLVHLLLDILQYSNRIPGARLNIKMSHQYRDSPYKDKMVSQPS